MRRRRRIRLDVEALGRRIALDAAPDLSPGPDVDDPGAATGAADYCGVDPCDPGDPGSPPDDPFGPPTDPIEPDPGPFDGDNPPGEPLPPAPIGPAGPAY